MAVPSPNTVLVQCLGHHRLSRWLRNQTIASGGTPKLAYQYCALIFHRVVRSKSQGTCSQCRVFVSDHVSLGKSIISPGLSFLICRVDWMVFKFSLALKLYNFMKLGSAYQSLNHLNLTSQFNQFNH